jgi:ribosomal protein S18 acetylase RimI-like enzyme
MSEPSGKQQGAAMHEATIVRLDSESARTNLASLSAILHACVHAGASVGFVMPFPREESDAWWRDAVLPAVTARERVLLVAEVDGALVATGQLQLAQLPNQLHRADVMKVLTHPDHRRRGYARAIMAELERIASENGKRTLTLDTRSGDTAEPLYRSLGYAVAGSIPGYCRHPFEDRLEATTYMHKAIGSATGNEAPGIAGAATAP